MLITVHNGIEEIRNADMLTEDRTEFFCGLAKIHKEEFQLPEANKQNRVCNNVRKVKASENMFSSLSQRKQNNFWIRINRP